MAVAVAPTNKTALNHVIEAISKNPNLSQYWEKWKKFVCEKHIQDFELYEEMSITLTDGTTISWGKKGQTVIAPVKGRGCLTFSLNEDKVVTVAYHQISEDSKFSEVSFENFTPKFVILLNTEGDKKVYARRFDGKYRFMTAEKVAEELEELQLLKNLLD